MDLRWAASSGPSNYFDGTEKTILLILGVKYQMIPEFQGTKSLLS